MSTGRTILIPVLGKEYLSFSLPTPGGVGASTLLLGTGISLLGWLSAAALFVSSKTYCQFQCALAGVVYARCFGVVTEYSQLCHRTLRARIFTVVIIIAVVLLSVCIAVLICSATPVTGGTILVIVVSDNFSFEE